MRGSLLSHLSICGESVRPSQGSFAAVGSQLDDPLAAAVAVVQVQEVSVRVQAVLTWGGRSRERERPVSEVCG